MPPLLQMKFPYRLGFISGLFCGCLFISWADPQTFSFLFPSGQEKKKKSSMSSCQCRRLCAHGIMLRMPSRAPLLLVLPHLSSYFLSFVTTLSIDCSRAGVCPSSILWLFSLDIVFPAVPMCFELTPKTVCHSSFLAEPQIYSSHWYLTSLSPGGGGWGSQSFPSQHI